MTAPLHHHRRGSGEPLVLIHGIGSRWQVWEPLLDRLAQHCEVIAVDLPGFGQTPADPAVSTVDELAESVATFCAGLGLDRPHMAGNSMGGGIALSLGSQGLARSVTAFSPIGFWSAPGLLWCQAALRAMRVAGARSRPALPYLVRNSAARTVLFGLFFGQPWAHDPAACLDDVDGLLGAPGFDRALSSFTGFTPPTVGELAEIPVTVAWGSRDALLTYPTQSRRAKAKLRHARHVSLPDSGHVPFADDPSRCAEILLDQLEV